MRSNWRQSGYADWDYGMPPLPAVKWLLIINIAIFCLNAVLSKFFDINLISSLFALHSLEACRNSSGIFHYGYLWEPVTYMFLHIDPWHILFNLLMFYLFANQVEAEIGSKRLLQI